MNALGSFYKGANSYYNSVRIVLYNRPVVSLNHVSEYSKSAEEMLGLVKPKKPVPPFFKFSIQMRPALLAKQPGIKPTKVMQLIAEHWKEVGAEVKSKLETEYLKEKELYSRNKEEYDLSLTEEQKEDIKNLKEKMVVAKEKRKHRADIKQLGRPKRPMSSYILFSQSEKSTIKDKGLVKFQLQMAKKWKESTNEEKAVWEDKAKVLKEAYKKEMTEWEEKMVRLGNIDMIRNSALVEKNKKKKEQ